MNNYSIQRSCISCNQFIFKCFFSMGMHEVKLNAKGSKGSKGAPFGRKVLKIDRPKGRRVLKFDGPTARGLWYRPAGNDYKVSVTGLAFVSPAVHGEVPVSPSSGRGAP